MSRILEALRRIEVKTPEGTRAAPAATANGLRREETGVRQPRDAAVLEHPQAIVSRREPIAGDPPSVGPPPEAQVVYSLEKARALLESAQADPEHEGQFVRLADAVVEMFPQDRRAVLMFTSPGNGEGKTSVTAGLAEALAAQVSGEVVVQTIAGWRAVLEKLRGKHQYVLLDAPSVAHPETLSTARSCDGVFLVLRLGRTGRRAARKAVEVLQRAGAKVLGCVVTGA